MKLGINTYTYMWAIGFEGARPEQPLTALGLLEKARQLGVGLVQSGPNLPLDQLSEPELATFEAQARSTGIELEVGTRGLEMEHLLGQIVLCRRLGSKLLRTIPEIGGQTPPSEEIVHHLRLLQPELDRQGVRLGLENGRIPAADLADLLRELDSPVFGVVLDMVNSLAVPEGWKEVTRLLAPYTMCLHFKDFAIRRLWHGMGFLCEGRPAGQGQIDAGWLFETLRPSPHDFNVILELWTPEQETLAETVALEQDWAVESISYLRNFVKG